MWWCLFGLKVKTPKVFVIWLTEKKDGDWRQTGTALRNCRCVSAQRALDVFIHPPNRLHLPLHTHIQDDRDASPWLRGEELLLSHGHLLLAGGVLPAGDVLVVAHFGDDPADEPVDSTGLGAAVSGLRCRRGLAVLTGYGFRLLAAFLGSKFGLFFVQQFVDPVPTVARCLLTHPFAAERSCCALWGRERSSHPLLSPTQHIPCYITAPTPKHTHACISTESNVWVK